MFVFSFSQLGVSLCQERRVERGEEVVWSVGSTTESPHKADDR